MHWNSRKTLLTLSGLLAAALGGATPADADLTRPQTFKMQDPNSFGVTFGIQSPFWQNSRLSPLRSPFERTAAINALVQQNPLLVRLQSWRTAPTGNELVAQVFQLNDQNGIVRIGSQPLPISELANLGGSTTAVGLHLSRIAFGSTAPIATLSNTLSDSSTLENGGNFYGPPQASDDSRMTWFTARPLQTKNGNIDLMYVRGRRDLTPTLLSSKTFAQSTIWGGHGEFTLPSQWKMRGEWMNAKADDQSDAKTAWKLVAGGPVKNPLGILRIDADYSVIDPGFAPHTVAQPPSVGQRGGDLTMSQDLKMGDLTGNARLAFNQTQRPIAAPSSDTPTVSIPLQSLDTTNATAHLRWQVASNVAIQSDHSINNVEQEMLRTPDGNRDPHHYQQSTHDVGVEVKISPSLALTVSAGLGTNNDYTFLSADNSLLASTLRNDRHIALGITRRTKLGSLGIQATRKNYDETWMTASSNVRKNLSNVQLDAERQICPWLKLKGSLRLAGENDALQQLWSDDSQQSIEAQMSFKKWGQLGLRYSDWAQRHYAVNGDGAIPNGATREYGIRYQVGATGNEPGLGIVMEYVARDDRAGADSNNLKVGVTYK